MTSRTVNGTTYTQTFDVENRLTNVTRGANVTKFYYDPDGNRILTILPGGTKVYTPFPEYAKEVPSAGSFTERNHYSLAGQLVAVRVKPQGQSGTYYYVHTDRQGSVYTMRQGNGAWVNGNYARYDAYGGYRSTPSATVNPGISDRGYTGHKHNNTGDNDIGLIYMNARYYMPGIGRFISADTIVPDPQNPQSYNRYTYTVNNPVNYTDPSGHRECIDQLCDVVWNEFTDRPAMNGPVPPVIAYIYEEMIQNATGDIAAMIRYGNFLANFGFPVIGNVIAYGVWASQVMDATIKNHVGPLSPYLANWDHKPILNGELGPSPVPEIAKTGWATVGDYQYRFDIWSNIHYGYVGAAASFSEAELIDGAGLEQIGTDLVNSNQPFPSNGAPTFLSSWDQPSDTASIDLGSKLWYQYGLAVSPADLYLAILEAPELASR